MQEPRHHDAAAESTPQHDDANGVANTEHETTDNNAGHETASQPPEQPEAIVAEAVPVTTIQPPAATGKLPQEQEAALLRRYGGAGATVTTDGQTVVISNILLAAFGEEGLSAATNLLHMIWWPATLVRLLVYLAISWLLLPHLNRHIREQALQRIAAQREASLADGVLDHERLQKLDAAETHIHQAGITPKFLLGLLLAFDVVALQLPYLLH